VKKYKEEKEDKKSLIGKKLYKEFLTKFWLKSGIFIYMAPSVEIY